jgi:hypothetical protein
MQIIINPQHCYSNVSTVHTYRINIARYQNGKESSESFQQ